NAVSAISSNDVWAVGVYQDHAAGLSIGLVEHWDGKLWSIIPAAVPNAPHALTLRETFSGVAAIAHDDVWVVGSYLDSILGETPGTSTTFARTLVEHWDGKAWHV